MLETRFAPDSLLEGNGFEPSVPGAKEPVSFAKANCGGSNGGGLLKLFLCGVPMVRIHLPPAGSLQTFGPSRVALQVMTDFEAGCCGSGCKARAGHGNQIGRTAAFIACRPVIAPATPEPLLCLAVSAFAV